jgi:hypothetical protein
MYTLEYAAKLANAPVGTVRMWFTRGHLFLHHNDRAAIAAGGTRRLSANTVLCVAITAALAQLDVPVARAARAASAFAHTDSGFPRREGPMALYRSPGGGACATCIATSPDEPCRIFPVEAGVTDAFSILAMIGAGAALLPVDDIVDRITTALRQSDSPGVSRGRAARPTASGMPGDRPASGQSFPFADAANSSNQERTD